MLLRRPAKRGPATLFRAPETIRGPLRITATKKQFRCFQKLAFNAECVGFATCGLLLLAIVSVNVRGLQQMRGVAARPAICCEAHGNFDRIGSAVLGNIVDAARLKPRDIITPDLPTVLHTIEDGL